MDQPQTPEVTIEGLVAALAVEDAERLDTSEGGLVVGPGGPTDDQVPAWLNAGAFVLNAKAVEIIGKDALDALVQLCREVRFPARLSADEYVVPADVVGILGRRFWHGLNDAGRMLRAGTSPDPAQHRAAMLDHVGDALDTLLAIKAAPTGPEARRALELAAREDSRTAPADGVLCLAGGGLGVALGAAVDEVNRQRQLDRQDKADARAEEALNLQKQTHAQVVAANGIKLAKAQQEQDEATAVREHLKSWSQGRQRIQQGDYSDFARELQAYNANSDAYADGYKLLPQSTAQGQVLNHVNGKGEVMGTYGEGDALQLFDAAMAKKMEFISPTYFEHARKATAEAKAKAADRASREKIAGIYADARMYGADVRADSAEEIAGIRADASRYSADRRGASGPMGLTLAQQRANAEIDAAREMVAGLSDDEIKRRTQEYEKSGRVNESYDASLSRAVKLAGRRKVGDDQTFDARTGGHGGRDRSGVAQIPNDLADVVGGGAMPSAAPKKTPKQAAEAAMAADPGMKGFTLGEQTGRGFKVLDANGKHVGYWGR